jgi:hypothetical protein
LILPHWLVFINFIHLFKELDFVGFPMSSENIDELCDILTKLYSIFIVILGYTKQSSLKFMTWISSEFLKLPKRKL